MAFTTKDLRTGMADSPLGTALKGARENAGLTQAQVARELNVEPVTVSRWERGIHPPAGDLLLRLQRLYEVEISVTANGMAVTKYLGERRPQLGVNVPRGTPRGVLESAPRPYEVSGRFVAFVRDMIREGATDEEADFLAYVLRRPETDHLIQKEEDGQPLSDDGVFERWDALLDDFRAFIKRRIARRSGAIISLDSAEIERVGLAGLRRPTAEERTRGTGAAETEAPRPAARKPGKRAGRGR